MTYVQPPPLPSGRPGREPAPELLWGPPAEVTHPRGTLVLVLGILSVVTVQVLGPFAWWMGRSALQEADASGRPVRNRSALQVGMVLGVVGTVLGVLALLSAAVVLGVLL